MSVSERERNHPTKAELEELLAMLLAAAEEGQLVSLVFMLQDREGNAMVDYRGCHEFTEMAARTVRERIAQEVRISHPLITQRIHGELARELN
ncbi:hypothetical protein [Stenotrophomonas acidaminiphila]|uniref:hypothetical protein n=1 Tax=Stenotrophomonas acidaminiphila TaxID=128780 RepID=UPI001FAFCD5D|nr:hypothetical protein [Stenotrophomonas acidaminiphila]